MVVIARLGVEPNPDFPKNSPPRPIPTPTDIVSGITTSMATSTPTSSPTSAGTGNGFFRVAEDGTSGDKILRGFLIGMAIGIILSFVLCCWLPCLRRRPRSRLQRRNDNIRRRLVVLEDEAWVSHNWPHRRPWDVGEGENEGQSHVST
ncbi:hypothetical protein V8C37DRAFT_218623 [Trichoderma ceciliae]